MKKAMQWLDAADLEWELIDYKNVGVVEQCLPDWCSRVGWQVLLNRQGLSWKKLEAAQREGIDETSACALMKQYPTLIKRPVLDSGKALLVGFDAECYRQRLLTA